MGIKPYKVCVSYKAKYPTFSKEMFDVDLDSTHKLRGEVKVEYGAVKECKKADGVVNVAFTYSTTEEAKETMKKKW